MKWYSMVVGLVIAGAVVLFNLVEVEVRVSKIHEGVESVSGGKGLGRYLDWGVKLRQKGVKYVDVVLTDKMRTDCPVYDGANKSLRWGVTIAELKEDEIIVYVWGREDALQSKGASRELTEYVAGCLKQGEKVAEEPKSLVWWEKILLLVQPVMIKYATN